MPASEKPTVPPPARDALSQMLRMGEQTAVLALHMLPGYGDSLRASATAWQALTDYLKAGTTDPTSKAAMAAGLTQQAARADAAMAELIGRVTSVIRTALRELETPRAGAVSPEPPLGPIPTDGLGPGSEG